MVSKEARNLNDDAAIFRPKVKNEIVISTDSLVEGIHFFGHENPSDIAKKSLRVNLSDMAAMGAKPIFYNLALNIPKHKVQKFIPKFSFAGLIFNSAFIPLCSPMPVKLMELLRVF